MKNINMFRMISLIFYLAVAIFIWLMFDFDKSTTKQWMDAYVRNHGLWGIFIYTAATTILIAMGVPRQICSFMGGYVFGLWQGTLLATMGTALACIICFSYARFIGQEWINDKYRHKLTSFNNFICQSPFLLSLIVRIVPLGSNFITNFLAGISAIPAKSFLGGSIIGFTAQNFIFALMGSGIQLNSKMNTFYSIILYITSLCLGYWVYARYKNYKQQSNIINK